MCTIVSMCEPSSDRDIDSFTLSHAGIGGLGGMALNPNGIGGLGGLNTMMGGIVGGLTGAAGMTGPQPNMGIMAMMASTVPPPVAMTVLPSIVAPEDDGGDGDATGKENNEDKTATRRTNSVVSRRLSNTSTRRHSPSPQILEPFDLAALTTAVSQNRLQSHECLPPRRHSSQVVSPRRNHSASSALGGSMGVAVPQGPQAPPLAPPFSPPSLMPEGSPSFSHSHSHSHTAANDSLSMISSNMSSLAALPITTADTTAAAAPPTYAHSMSLDATLEAAVLRPSRTNGDSSRPQQQRRRRRSSGNNPSAPLLQPTAAGERSNGKTMYYEQSEKTYL